MVMCETWAFVKRKPDCFASPPPSPPRLPLSSKAIDCAHFVCPSPPQVHVVVTSHCIVSTPCCFYSWCCFVSSFCRQKESTTIYPADVILFEGILTIYFKELRDMLDMKLFVDTDSDTRLSRRGNNSWYVDVWYLNEKYSHLKIFRRVYEIKNRSSVCRTVWFIRSELILQVLICYKRHLLCTVCSWVFQY